ncbi:MAG: 50S ribosomal protein L6 [Phycisphaerales bacterium]|nr:50S ribosomal protein L6 [Phycisphaerales bacterium]
MSRLGKKAVQVPAGVKVNIAGQNISVEGPKGSLSFEFRPEVEVTHDEGGKVITVHVSDELVSKSRVNRAYWGTTRSLIDNMVVGVTKGYEKKLNIVGVGWTGNVSGNTLSLKVGFANIIEMPIPTGVTVTAEKQLVTVSGADKQAVGHFAASVRAKRKPEPYNGKGIKYLDEVITRKQGKAFGN